MEETSKHLAVRVVHAYTRARVYAVLSLCVDLRNDICCAHTRGGRVSPFENSQPSAISPNTPNTPGADAFGDVPDQKGSKRASLCGVGKKVCLVDVDHTDGPRLWRGVLPGHF